jgi:non-ribosomal peptide synthetase component F
LKRLFGELTDRLAKGGGEVEEPTPYRNHVAQVRRLSVTRDAEAFFRKKLGDLDEPTMAFSLPELRGKGSTVEASMELESAIVARLRERTRRSGMSMATLAHAAWALVVARSSGRADVAFGTVLSGRLQATSTQHTLGMFINTLPLRLPLDGLSARELVAKTHSELGELLDYEQASLAVAQRCSAIGSAAPLFNALLNYLHEPVDLEKEFERLPGVSLVSLQGATNYPIVLSVHDWSDRVLLQAKTDGRIQPERVLGYMASAMSSLLHALEDVPDSPALTLSILPSDERARVLELFNATQASLPDKTIHELFEEQVRLLPNAVAVTHEGRALSYSELNARCNQLARYLIARGLGPDELAAICLERSVDLIVAMFAVLMAGGAYIPLD